MLSNIEIGAANVTSSGNGTSAVKTEKKISTEKKEVEPKAKEEKPTKKAEKCDKEKKSLCKGSGGMQLGGTKMKLKKPKSSD
jgi:hypothetical protein